VRGIARWNQGKRKEATEDFERAYRLDKSWFGAIVWAYGQIGDSAKAKQILQEQRKRISPSLKPFQERARKRFGWGFCLLAKLDWLSGRWIKGVGIKSGWAVEISCFSTRNAPKLNGAVVFAINGQPIHNWQEYWERIRAITEKAKAGDKVTFSIWRNGKVEDVEAVSEPLLP